VAAQVVPSEGLGAECVAFLFTDEEKSNRGKGTQVHRVIREQLARWFRDAGYGERIPIHMPDASFAPFSERNSLPIGDKRIGEGDVDLAYRTRSGDVIGLIEIKPANFPGLREGEIQVDNYVDKANANDDLKRRLQAKEFRRLQPTGIEPPLPTVVWQSRTFEIRWCRPGLLFYKEIRKKKKEEEEKEKEKRKEQSPRRSREAQPADPRATAGARQIVLSNGLRVDVFERPWQPPAWMPAELRQAVQTGALRDGVYRDRFTAPYLNGYSTNILVYVRTSSLGREYQFQLEFPTNPAFYEDYARRYGLSQWQGRLLQTTLVTSNNDMWSLIRPDREDPRDIYSAREELRTIYAGLMRQVFEASAVILGSGAGISAMNSTAQRGAAAYQRSTTGRSIAEPAAAGVRAPADVLPAARIPNTPEDAFIFEQFIRNLRSRAPGP
jgi:hypothetical protein